jgi:hypothetical protein
VDDSKRRDSQVATIGLEVRHPELTFATPDHDVSTLGNELTAISEPFRREIVGAWRIMHGSTASCSLVSRQAPGHSLTEALRQMGRLHGTHLEGRESNRSAGGAVDQVRFCDQSEDAKALGIEVPPTRANEVIE